MSTNGCTFCRGCWPPPGWQSPRCSNPKPAEGRVAEGDEACGALLQLPEPECRSFRSAWSRRLEFPPEDLDLSRKVCETAIARRTWRSSIRGWEATFCRACIGNPPYATQRLVRKPGLISRLASFAVSTADSSFRRHFQIDRRACIGALTMVSDGRDKARPDCRNGCGGASRIMQASLRIAIRAFFAY